MKKTLKAISFNTFRPVFCFIKGMNKNSFLALLVTTFGFVSLAFADASPENIKKCHEASFYGNINLVKGCLKSGYDINQKDKKGRTLLQMAILGEGKIYPSKKKKKLGHNIKLIEWLLTKSDLKTVDNNGESLAHSIVLKINDKTAEKYKKILENSEIALNLESQYKRTPLMSAVYAGNIEAIKVLLSLGVDPNYRNEYRYSVSKYIAISNNREAMLLLLDNGLDLSSKDKSGYTLLAQVVKHGRVEMFEDLIKRHPQQMYEKESNKYYEAGFDGTLFDIALSYNQFEIADRILELGYPVDYQKKYGETALMEHALFGSYKKLEYLLSKNANISIKNNFSETALDKASAAANNKVMELLSK